MHAPGIEENISHMKKYRKDTEYNFPRKRFDGGLMISSINVADIKKPHFLIQKFHENFGYKHFTYIDLTNLYNKVQSEAVNINQIIPDVDGKVSGILKLLGFEPDSYSSQRRNYEHKNIITTAETNFWCSSPPMLILYNKNTSPKVDSYIIRSNEKLAKTIHNEVLKLS